MNLVFFLTEPEGCQRGLHRAWKRDFSAEQVEYDSSDTTPQANMGTDEACKGSTRRDI